MDGAVDPVPFRAPQASGAGCDSARVTSIFGDILKLDSTKKVSFVIHCSMLFSQCNVSLTCDYML